MNSWNVFIKIDDMKVQEIELFDTKSYFDGYLKIKRSYFNRLTKAIKISKNYMTKHGIERVLAPNKEDWTSNPWMLLLIKDFEKEMPFWLFIKREKDLSGTLIAIGPKKYADFNNKNLSDAKRDLKRLINFIVSYVKKFACIIVLPNFLS